MTERERSQGAPQSPDQVRERILASLETLPKRLRQCGDYVLNNPEKIAVSTVAELAAGAQVQPSALMRFCQTLGFSGFSEMQKLYRDVYAERWPDYATRLARLRERDGEAGPLLSDFIEASHKSLELMAETLDLKALARAAALLRDAATIHLVGLRRSLPAASYLAYMLGKMRIPVVLHDGVGGISLASAVRRGDALIAISFAPYTEDTVALARHAAEAGTVVVAITDGRDSPIGALPGEVLIVREIDVGAFRSLAATLTLVTALAVSVGAARSDH